MQDGDEFSIFFCAEPGKFGNFEVKIVSTLCLKLTELDSAIITFLLQVALARLTKQGHRPLGRTQSAPLPLGHPLLATGHNLGVHYEDCQQPLTAHNFLKQVRYYVIF